MASDGDGAGVVSIRAVAPEDDAWFKAVVQRARIEFDTRRGGGLLASQSGGKEAGRTLLGCLGGVPVGLARALLDEGPAGLVRVEWLYVEPPSRGAGVGRALLDGLLAWGDSLGAAGVDVTALPGDRATKSFLESAGFKARLLVMHRALPGSGEPQT